MADGSLLAFGAGGHIRWRFSDAGSGEEVPEVTERGNVFIPLRRTFHQLPQIVALDCNGIVRWRISDERFGNPKIAWNSTTQIVSVVGSSKFLIFDEFGHEAFECDLPGTVRTRPDTGLVASASFPILACVSRSL